MAGSEWYVCKVVRTGVAAAPEDNQTINIKLRELNEKFTGDRWFPAATSSKEEILATALTAITSGSTVEAYLSSPVQYEGVVQRLYIASDI